MSLHGCDNTNFDHITAVAPADSDNTDGVHIKHVNGLNITNSNIKTGDDCVSIGDGSKNVHMEKLTCGPGHGISIGSLGKYANEKPVQGIWVKNCTITGTSNGVRIKTWPNSPPGTATDIHFDDIIMNNVGNPILIDQEYCASRNCKNLRFSLVKNSLLKDVTSLNSKFFHMSLHGCDNTNLDHITAVAPADIDNTDGVHIKHVNGLNITNSNIKIGDDCVSIGDGSKNVHLEKLTCGPGHGISIGSLGKYANEKPVQGIWVKNCTITGTSNGVRIKTWPNSPPGTATDIHFDDIIMNNVGNPILIDQEYCASRNCKNLRFSLVKNSLLKDVTSLNSKFFHMSLHGCDNTNLDHITAVAPADIDNKRWSSHQAHGSKNVHLEKLTCGPGHGISIGSLGKYANEKPVQGIWVKNCTITGTSNGNLRFSLVKNSLLKDVTSLNSKFFHMSLHGCDNTNLDHITAVAPADIDNTDGVHIKHVNGLNITNSNIKIGDDCVSIGDGSKNVHLEKLTCGPGHGISIGSLGKYANEKPVQGIWVKNCTITGTSNGVRIKTWPNSPPGTATDIHFDDIIMNNVGNPILIDQEYCASRNCKNLRFSLVKNSLLKDVTSLNSKFFHMSLHGCDNTNLDHITAVAPADIDNTDGVHIKHVNGLNITNSNIKIGDDCVSIGDGSKNVHLEKLTCGPGHGISIGSLGKYANEKPVQGIWVKNCTITGTSNGVRIKTWPNSPPGTATDIHFDDIIMNNVGNPILIDQEYCASRNCKNLRFSLVKNSLLKDVTSLNSKFFHMSLHGCDNTNLDHITAVAPADIDNTDGVHIKHVNGLNITNSNIKIGDDCVSIGDGSKNVHLEKLTCGPGHGISIGSLGKYANEKPVQGIWVKNCTITGTSNGVRIKTWPNSPPGTATGIHFDDIIMNNVGNRILIDQEYCASRNCKNLRFSLVKNSLLKDVTSLNSKFFHMSLHGCDNTNLDHITAVAPADSDNTDGVHIKHVNGLNITNSNIKTGDDCVSIGDGSKNVHLEKLTCGPGHGISIGSLGKYANEKPVQGIWV
ncbi:hypothetical protein OSB04_006303 [Centaurea solstitialis]|uniref:Polygalacturonase n=1 Tax=Centaurea solstitialis TaxID=347529 RepID=A0AA38U297_9ASTR|nr:hypothetical protein OSB04_006303 [Centaurea solstitialis]